MPTETIVQIITLSLIILIPLMLWGTRPSWWAVIGCLMYTASYFIANAFHLAWLVLPGYETLEQIGKAKVASDLLGTLPPTPYGFALRIYQASTLLLVALYAWIIFIALWRNLQDRLVWLVLAIAETFAVLEYVQCKMLIDPFGSQDLHLTQIWGLEVSNYACGRAFGAASPHVVPIITSLYLVWVIIRRRQKG